jgi:Tol biopolymer transport system component
MKRNRLTVLLLIMILIPGAGIIYLLGTPNLTAVYPDPGSAQVPAGEPLSLSFSRLMQQSSVIERLTIDPVQEGSFSWQGSTLIFTPSQPWPSGQSIRVQLAAGAQSSGFLPFSIREEASWSFTIGQPRLAYLFPTVGPSNLYVMNLQTTDSQQLTNSRAGILEFDLNPTGSILYYSENGPDASVNIYALPLLRPVAPLPNDQPSTAPEFPEPVLLVDCPQASCRAPKISADGQYLAYERTDLMGQDRPTHTQVWLLPLDNGLPFSGGFQPYPAGDPSHETLQPAWSSQGWLSYYDNDLAAFLFVNPHTGELNTYPSLTGEPGTWSPNRELFVTPEIVLASGNVSPSLPNVEPIASSHLIAFNLEDDRLQDLTKAENQEEAAPAYAPDGTKIAFARKYLDTARWTPGRQLWILQLDSGQARQLTGDPFYNHYDFSWAPDGGRLAFVRFNQTLLTEPPEIWVIDTINLRANRLVVGGYDPKWMP